jgi:hypothetical protein
VASRTGTCQSLVAIVAPPRERLAAVVEQATYSITWPGVRHGPARFLSGTAPELSSKMKKASLEADGSCGIA